MTDQTTPNLPPPSAPEAQPAKRSWLKRKAGPLPVWAWIVGAFVGLMVYAGMTAPPKDKEASADAAATTVATSAAPAVTQATTPATEPTTTTAAPEPTQPPTTAGIEADASAKLACRHYRNVAQDASDGLYTDDELRTKLKEVNNDAQYSETPGIADGAKKLLAGVTQGTLTEADVIAMLDACAAAGQ